MHPGEDDVDYLAARLHGRRSRLAEGERLVNLCQLRSLPELAVMLYPGSGIQTAVQLERRLVEDLAGELTEVRSHLSGAGARLLHWMLVRFQLENIKVLIRVVATGTAWPRLEAHWVPLPDDLALDMQTLSHAGSVPELIACLPESVLRASLERALAVYGNQAKPFFLEAMADCSYFRELLASVGQLRAEERALIQPLVSQEVDVFHLMVITRGRFHYGLTAVQLQPLHVDGTAIGRARWLRMLAAPDLRSAAQWLPGHVVDSLPPESVEAGESLADPSTWLEMLAWKRFLRLANSAFRRSHIGLGAVAGYFGIRRVEVANLITISEGIRRRRLPAEAIRGRLICCAGEGEAAYV